MAVGKRTFQGSLGEPDLNSDLPCHWGLPWAVNTCSCTQKDPSIPPPGHQLSSEELQEGNRNKILAFKVFFCLVLFFKSCRQIHTREKCYYTSNAFLERNLVHADSVSFLTCHPKNMNHSSKRPLTLA